MNNFHELSINEYSKILLTGYYNEKALLFDLKNIEIVEHIIQELGGNRRDLITYVKDRLGHDWRYAINHSKITKELGWKPKTSFLEGIKKTIQHYKGIS